MPVWGRHILFCFVLVVSLTARYLPIQMADGLVTLLSYNMFLTINNIYATLQTVQSLGSSTYSHSVEGCYVK